MNLDKKIDRPLPRDLVANMSQYSPLLDEATCILDANESPFELTSQFKKKLIALFDGLPLHRYPDHTCSALKDSAAKIENVEPSNIVFGNGSDELINIIISTYADPNDSLLIFNPTFSMYETVATILSLDVIKSDLTENFQYNIDEAIKLAQNCNVKIIFVARPNNPDGSMLPKEDLIKLAESVKSLIVVDEAYIDYATEESVGTIFKKYPNIIVIKTLSKIGFAALRLGYLLADKNLTKQLDKVRMPFNINMVSQIFGSFIFDHKKDINHLLQSTINEREQLYTALNEIDGAIAYRSAANFILIKVVSDPETIFKKLLEEKIRVRWFSESKKLRNYFRITIGLPSENKIFLHAFQTIMSSR
ncbi:MAG: histidinol-phosphate transaminase [Nitrospinota bacterium]